MDLTARLYRSLLRIYPPGHRSEFGDEQLQVFHQAALEARRASGRAYLRLLGRELGGLLGAALRLRCRQVSLARLFRRVEMAGGLFPESSDQAPWGEALWSLAPLLLAGPLAVLVSYHPWWDPEGAPWVFSLYAAITALSICVALWLGVARKFPRWSYPYAVYFVMLVTFLVTYLANGTPWNIEDEGGILALVLALSILVSALLPAFRPFYANLRRDWTLLSYALYACTLFVLPLHDQDISPRLDLLVMLPALIGVLGALVHLRLPSAPGRLAVLLFSMLLGVFFMVIPISGGMLGEAGDLNLGLSLLLILWGILGGLLLAPLLIRVFAHPRQAAPEL